MQEELEDEDKFERMLMDKYPALFHEVNGKPVAPECGISCPKGWQKIVDDLCDAINRRTTEAFIYKVKNNKKYHMRLALAITKVKSYLYKKFNPYKGIRSAIRFNSPKPEEMARAKKKLSYKFFHLFELAYCALTSDAFEKVPVSPPVKIAQVKEKFGTLRFYYDGGDDQIRGMVEFVEYLSSKICQETGEKGQLCKRRGTYATFSIDKAKEFGYDVVDETRYL